MAQLPVQQSVASVHSVPIAPQLHLPASQTPVQHSLGELHGVPARWQHLPVWQPDSMSGEICSQS
jgi:hypothetical protein